MRSAASVLLVLAGTTAWASPFPKDCNKGPDYWCVDYRNAAECGAIGHCTQTVWTKQRYPFDSSPVAIKFVKLFDRIRQSRSSFAGDGVQEALEATCRSVPHVAAGARCKQYVADMSPHVGALLDSEMSSTAVCSVLKLCNNDKMTSLLHTPKHNKAGTHKPKVDKSKLLGSDRCTWGPSYWCGNFSTAHDCHAIKHCVHRVWNRMQVTEDSDDICKICTDMVKQARDQLQSNETQEELKEVFEGSCQLIPIKLVAKECMRLADDFVPELVETLASEMNPQQVCSVAGLCNSARIDKLLAQYKESTKSDLEAQRECAGCHHVVGLARKKFDHTDYEQFLVNLLSGCRNLGSFSDSCSMLVFAHYEDILSALQQHLNADEVCHLSGQCSAAFHSHADDYAPLSGSSVALGGNGGATGDDLPCELCQQLVKHMRDVIVANTTELEFLAVLKGLCKQTGNFKTECLSLVEQWYPVVYNYLVSDLKPNEVCSLGGICPLPSAASDVQISPLLPSELVVKTIVSSNKLIGQDEYNSYKVGAQPAAAAAQAPYPLPLERMFVQLPAATSQTKCTLCQYILHYLQVEISDSRNEDVIRDAVEHACERLPHQVSTECKQFVQAYGPMVISLLVQEIDPASVCPAIGLCPKIEEVRLRAPTDRPNCPLCLFAVEQLEAVLKTNKTEASIVDALEHLCSHLSENLKPKCVSFVDEYAAQLVDMLEADLDAKEICVYLKLCADTMPDPLRLRPAAPAAADAYHPRPHLRGDGNRFRKRPLESAAGDIETNEIRDSTYNGQPLKGGQKSLCVICEFVMKEIDSEIKDKNNEDEIKKIVHGICNRMPRSVVAECNKFVDKYADLVVALLAQELDADEVCQALKLCEPSQGRRRLRENILDCAVCETVVAAVDKVLGNPAVDRRVVHVVEKACGMLPAKYNGRCHMLMEVYGDSVIHLIEQYGSKGVCNKIGLCGAYEGAYIQMYRGRRQ